MGRLRRPRETVWAAPSAADQRRGQSQAAFPENAVTAYKLQAMLDGARIDTMCAEHVEHILFKPRGWMSEPHSAETFGIDEPATEVWEPCHGSRATSGNAPDDGKLDERSECKDGHHDEHNAGQHERPKAESMVMDVVLVDVSKAKLNVPSHRDEEYRHQRRVNRMADPVQG